MSDERPPSSISCSFCRRDSTEAAKMVASHDVAICDDCIGVCLGTLATDPDLFEATIERARTLAAASRPPL
ncbi:ClpX C4-type zinc finger protein [Caulobacter sp. UNC279MFTsu5.1]|uniref:ClpX C4-type zinc finger protein n=1 Tax=Caulobacter sp. UNC279MFTsu5.1 TaxID=1502775 RepID=UPI000B7E685D